MSKLWVKQTIKKGSSFLPSFQETARAWLGICVSEDSKYPEERHKGSKAVTEFLRDLAAEFDKLTASEKVAIFLGNERWSAFWGPIADRHKLPKKDENQLKTTFKID